MSQTAEEKNKLEKARKKLGAEIVKLREKHDLSKFDIETKKGSHYHFIRTIEKGEKSYTIDSLFKYLWKINENASLSVFKQSGSSGGNNKRLIKKYRDKIKEAEKSVSDCKKAISKIKNNNNLSDTDQIEMSFEYLKKQLESEADLKAFKELLIDLKTNL